MFRNFRLIPGNDILCCGDPGRHRCPNLGLKYLEVFPLQALNSFGAYSVFPFRSFSSTLDNISAVCLAKVPEKLGILNRSRIPQKNISGTPQIPHGNPRAGLRGARKQMRAADVKFLLFGLLSCGIRTWLYNPWTPCLCPFAPRSDAWPG